MSTSFYLCEIANKEKKELIGIQTWEQRKCFTWAWNPAEFLPEFVASGFPDCVVIDEYGQTLTVKAFVVLLRDMDVSRYDKEDAKLLE